MLSGREPWFYNPLQLSLRKRFRMKAILLAGAGALVALGFGVLPAAERPNILLMLSDDHSYPLSQRLRRREREDARAGQAGG
jgi:hypothetical protein